MSVQVNTKKVISRCELPTNVPLRYSSTLYTTSALWRTLGKNEICPVCWSKVNVPGTTPSGALPEKEPVYVTWLPVSEQVPEPSAPGTRENERLSPSGSTAPGL